MLLGQYNNWNPQTNTCTGTFKDSHIAADSLASDYTDISSIENWAKYGPSIIGTTFGFKDWKCLQREIKALAITAVGGNFTTNWNNLTSDEKPIVCLYALSLVPPAKFAETIPDAEQRNLITIDFDLNNRRARGNWQSGTGRTQILRAYLFNKIGKVNALLTLVDAVHDGLLELYEAGISGTVEDGVVGINDFFLSRTGTPYENTGLTERGYAIIDGSDDTIDDVAAAMVEISNNGIY